MTKRSSPGGAGRAPGRALAASLATALALLGVGCGRAGPVDRASPPAEPFCGSSTRGACARSEDCAASGCSRQVCARASEEVVTTCEFRECYDARAYGLSCACVDGGCAWR